jgi:hypothetical protein
MAAPIDGDVAALGKLVFEKSNFKHAKSKHKEFIDDHHFNYSVMIARKQLYIGSVVLCCRSRRSALPVWGRRGRDRMVVGFTTTCTISAYHH